MTIEEIPSPNGRCNVFVYGGLREPEVQRQILGRRLPYEKATLPSAVIIRNERHWELRPAHNGNTALGGVMLIVEQDDLQKIDAYEGSSRREETLVDGKRAWVYERSRI